jgi:hypothetical protein
VALLNQYEAYLGCLYFGIRKVVGTLERPNSFQQLKMSASLHQCGVTVATAKEAEKARTDAIVKCL